MMNSSVRLTMPVDIIPESFNLNYITAAIKTNEQTLTLNKNIRRAKIGPFAFTGYNWILRKFYKKLFYESHSVKEGQDLDTSSN